MIAWLRKLVSPQEPASCQRMTRAADRMEEAAKRLEGSADVFGQMVREMQGVVLPPPRRKPSKKKRTRPP